MKTILTFMLRRCLTSLTGLVCIFSYGQDSLSSLIPEYRFIRSAFNQEDHFSFGFSIGVTTTIGQTQIIQSAPGLSVSNNFSPLNDYIFGGRNASVFAGYSYKNHIFQLNLVSAFTNLDYSLQDVDFTPTPIGVTDFTVHRKHTFMGLSFKYLYSLPFRSKFLKLSLGPQIGWTSRIPNSKYDPDNNGGYGVTATKGAWNNLLLGAGIRFDYKVARNISLFTEFTYSYLYQPNNDISLTYYHYDSLADSSSYVTGVVKETGHNFNLSFGFKFDFYSNRSQLIAFKRIQEDTATIWRPKVYITKRMLDTIPTYLLREVANRTNYFYLGIETGILFAPAWTRAEDPNQQQYASTEGEVTPLQSTRFFLGVAYKRNHFEFALGGLITNIGYEGDNLSRQYISLMFRYYYSALPHSKRWKLLTGPEIGIGFQTPINWIAGDGIWLNYVSYPGANYYQMYHATQPTTGIAGYNLRIQYKAAKNMSVFGQTGFSMSFTQILKNTTSIYYDGAYHPATFYGSTANFNFTIGLTIDMLDQKDFGEKLENRK